MITKTFEAIKATEIINAVSHLSSFTAKKAATLSSVNQSMVVTLVKKMNKTGAISVVGKRCGVNEYKVSKNALEIIDEKFNDHQSSAAKDDSLYDFKCEMKVVDKANVSGLGCLHLKRLDQLLAGMRA
ncbi:hypothetical protein GKR55_17590 [Providencia stuartii]|nr:hypothetical protein [Providencia stuartii]MTB82293.1 hypothetical protein [Providencia stuartii]